MSQSMRSSRRIVPQLVLATALLSSCNGQEPHDEPCYPPLSERELVQGVTQTLCFDYEGEHAPGARLPSPVGLPEDVYFEEFIYCFELTPGQACDACPAEDTEQLMREAYVAAKECEPPVADAVGECSHRYQTDDGYYAECCTVADCEQVVYAYAPGCAFTDQMTGECCYTAAIASPCGGRDIH